MHAGTFIDVAFTLVGHGLRVEVTDGSPHAPTVRGSGRGLMLLEMPLLLHEAWRQYAESLLRELLLATLDDELGADPIVLHAEASDAIALLAEQVPASEVPDDPDRVMVAGTEPQVTHPLVEPPVRHPRCLTSPPWTRRSAPRSRWPRAGGSSPPTQPEVQALRAWLCGQVARQAEGAAPRPWVLEVELPHRSARPPARDLDAVRQTGTAVVVADDEDLIVAASPAALSVLGYDDPQELVGQRLVAVIPERYGQAHLAGFTLHALTGRATLLGHPVVVPALRRRGTEVDVEMTIRRDRAGDGRTVFVAELVPVEAA